MKKADFLIVVFVILLCTAPGCAPKPILRDVSTDYDVIVIGAGMGGLSSATHLAIGGMKVLLLEQHYKVGGCTSSFERGDFKFETALHEMSMGGGDGIIRHILEKAGIHDDVELIRTPTLGRSIFPGFEFTHVNGVQETFDALVKQWPKEKESLEEFHEMLEEMHEETLELRDLYLANPLKEILTKLTVPLRQRTLTRYNNNTINEVFDDLFEDEKLKSVLSQFWVYYGPPPSQQWSLIYFVANYSYMRNGAWQIKGSSQALADAYAAQIEKVGGKIMTDSLVESIIVDDRDRARGITLASGEEFSAHYIVSSIDPFQVFNKMIPKEKTPRKIRKLLNKMEPSNSFVGVYLGLDVPLSHFGIKETDYEIIYNTSLDEDLMYRNMMAGNYDGGLVTITLYSNLKDPFYAPEGKSVVVLNAYSDISTWPKRGDEYYKQKEKMENSLIKLAENVLPNLSEHIEVREGMTPRTIHQYTLQHNGIPYGWNFTPGQSNRIPIATDIEGLYMTGSWVWPAHSVSMTQLSGYLTAQLILKRERLIE
ncbi:MAG: NAD(P)/FAD-dependent oxidoreductase [Deltaproteobacteria bacterium]|nr:NAD(P)/FAD-dependent oxidoreductase [Deltaproteobacteria bacterium]